MEMYSIIGDQIMIGKVIRRVEDESSNNVVLKTDFKFQRSLRPNVKYGWNDRKRSQYIITTDTMPIIVDGPIEIRVIRKDAVCNIKQLILIADSKRVCDEDVVVEEADAIDHRLAKIRVIKISSEAMKKRNAILNNLL